MDSVTAMMISLSLAGVICGAVMGIALYRWTAYRKEKTARSSTDWIDGFLTDVRERVGEYVLKNNLTKDQAEGFRNLISTMRGPSDIRLLKKWYEYTSGLMLTLAKSEGVSEPFKLYLQYVSEVIAVLVVNKLESTPPKRRPAYSISQSRRHINSWPVAPAEADHYSDLDK